MMWMKKTKAVVFDLDGTLLNTINDITDSLNMALAEINETPFSVDEVKHFVGSGVDVLISRMIAAKDLNIGLFDFIKQAYLRYYTVYRTMTTAPFAGIPELLKHLVAGQISVNVLSNKPEADTEPIIGRFFPDVRFGVIMGKRKEFPIKPDPKSVMHLLDTIDVRPEKALYVGDSEPDILTARNAGIESVGVLWGYRSREKLLAAGADNIVEKPEDILTIIKTREQRNDN